MPKKNKIKNFKSRNWVLQLIWYEWNLQRAQQWHQVPDGAGKFACRSVWKNIAAGKFARLFAFCFQGGAAGTGKATTVQDGWTPWQVSGWVTQGCATAACHPQAFWEDVHSILWLQSDGENFLSWIPAVGRRRALGRLLPKSSRKSFQGTSPQTVPLGWKKQQLQGSCFELKDWTILVKVCANNH